MSSEPVVVQTKLNIPAARPGNVRRRALVDVLEEGESARLILVAAPPGSGKTTLLAEWAAASRGRAFAWLSLDPDDSDPVQLWAGVIAALRRVLGEELGTAGEAALRAPGTSLERSVLPLLINELAAIEQRVVLVLDDYHAIAEPAAHESLAYLLDHLPPRLQIALATRSDPPLPLGRLRARAQLLEIRGTDLRFSGVEAEGLLNGALGLSLEPGDVERLHTRTEGWAAGLQLAGLSLRGRESVDEFITSFAGDDRQIVDYLGAEILDAQADELRAFLRRTAILDRLCGPLCDAVTGRTDSSVVLEEIERANLFVVALDARRDWYRYHHLFVELLRHDLARTEPELVAELHRRAATWFTREVEIPEAIHHAMEAGDNDEAAELIAAHWSMYFNRGRLATVARWLAALPPEVVEADSRLWLARVWTSMDRGDLDEAGALIAAADDDGGELEHWVAVLDALHRFKTGDTGRALALAREAVAHDGGSSRFPRTVARMVIATTSYWRGDLDRARATLADARGLALEDDNALATLYASGYLALVALDTGDLDEARRWLETRDGQVASDPGLDEHFVAAFGHLGQGRLRLLEGDADGARMALERAAELARRGASVVEIAGVLVWQAEALRALSDRAGAGRLLDEARVLDEEAPDAGRVSGQIAAALRGLRSGRAVAPATGPTDELSERELAVLRLLPTEMSQRDIGNTLYVSLNTVKSHTRRIFAKLGVSSREECVQRARDEGLL